MYLFIFSLQECSAETCDRVLLRSDQPRCQTGQLWFLWYVPTPAKRSHSEWLQRSAALDLTLPSCVWLWMVGREKKTATRSKKDWGSTPVLYLFLEFACREGAWVIVMDGCANLALPSGYREGSLTLWSLLLRIENANTFKSLQEFEFITTK